MTKTTLVFSCSHADPSSPNDRFSLLGNMIYEIKPDMVIDLGDGADMKSLNTYDTKYPKQVVTQSYEKDIDCYNDAQERLRWKFRHLKRRKPTWIGFEGNHECFQAHTEIFVKGKGWVPAPVVEKGDYVMGLGGEWDKVQETHRLWHEGPMVSYKNQTGEFSVTPNHRVYYYGSSGKMFVKEAKETPFELNLPVATKYKGVKTTGLTDDQIRFCAVACTDSHHKGENVTFYQSGKKADYIESIIQSVGVDYRKVVRERDISEICGVKLKNVKTTYEFHMKRPSWCSDSNKQIPEWAYHLSEKQADIFLDTLIFCDGSVFSDRASSVFYGKRGICGDVQAFCQMHGKRASVTEYREGQFRVNINPRDKYRFKKHMTDSIKDWVYCITVSGGNFLARQGGVSVYTGNCRIKKAIEVDPRLEGQKLGVSFRHLQTDHWFDEYHEYENGGPAIADYDGVSYAHYFSAGNYGTAVSGLHHAYTLIQNRNHSSTCGHSHKRSLYFKDSAHPNTIIGAVVGHFKGKDETWAGQSNRDWWRGVLVKRNVENGVYDPEWWSYKRIKETFGG